MFQMSYDARINRAFYVTLLKVIGLIHTTKRRQSSKPHRVVVICSCLFALPPATAGERFGSARIYTEKRFYVPTKICDKKKEDLFLSVPKKCVKKKSVFRRAFESWLNELWIVFELCLLSVAAGICGLLFLVAAGICGLLFLVAAGICGFVISIKGAIKKKEGGPALPSRSPRHSPYIPSIERIRAHAPCFLGLPAQQSEPILILPPERIEIRAISSRQNLRASKSISFSRSSQPPPVSITLPFTWLSEVYIFLPSFLSPKGARAYFRLPSWRLTERPTKASEK